MAGSSVVVVVSRAPSGGARALARRGRGCDRLTAGVAPVDGEDKGPWRRGEDGAGATGHEHFIVVAGCGLRECWESEALLTVL